MDYCKNCKRWTCGAQGTSHETSIPCGNYIPQTNADKIRAMSDEKLAQWLTHIEMMVLAKKPYITRSEMFADWLGWLKQEVRDGE